MKVLARLFSQIDTWQCSNLMKCTLIWIRELQEIKRLLSQMDILHQKLIKFWSRDTMICERVLGMWTPTPPGVEFWRTKIRFDPAGHRKRAQQQTTRICRAITLWCENKVFEKTRILAGPLDTFGAEPIRGAQQ